jgi:hypothetical protein
MFGHEHPGTEGEASPSCPVTYQAQKRTGRYRSLTATGAKQLPSSLRASPPRMSSLAHCWHSSASNRADHSTDVKVVFDALTNRGFPAVTCITLVQLT